MLRHLRECMKYSEIMECIGIYLCGNGDGIGYVLAIVYGYGYY